MKKNYKRHPEILIKNLLILMMILLVVWIVVSYLQIVMFNLSSNPLEHYSSWNFWTLFTSFN